MSTSKKPLVSVGVPVYNGELFIKESLESIRNQTYPNLEIIISDDQSTDASFALLKNIAKKDTRITLSQQIKRIGAINNFNYVLQKAQGEYFFWTAQDDIHDKKFIEKLLETLLKDRSIALAMSDYRNLHQGKTYKIYDPPTHKLTSKVDSLQYFLQTHNLSMFYGLYQTQILKKIGGYHADFRPYFRSSDFLMIFKMLLLGKLRFIDTVLFYKRDTGMYTDEFSNVQKKPMNILVNKIMRYALFPIHYVFDYIFGINYLVSSDLTMVDKIRVKVWLTKCTLRLFGGYIIKSTKGSMILICRIVGI